MPLLTTTIGSYPKPTGLKIPNWFEVRKSQAPGEWHPTKAYDVYLSERGSSDQPAIEAATIDVVREQVDAGVDVPTDGEIPREHYIYYQCRNFTGFDFRHLTRRAMRGGSWSAEVPTVTAEIKPGEPLLVRDWQVAQSATDRPVKITLPGPLTIMDSTANSYYRDEREMARDLADALNAEVVALWEAGCHWIQVDEPVFARAPERALEYGIDTLSRCFAGVGPSTKKAVHICCGYPSGLDLPSYPKADSQSYFRLAERLDEAEIDAVSLEDAHCHNDLKLLEKFQRITIMLGVVDIAQTRVEPAEHIHERLRSALEHIDRHRLMAAPDCGLIMLPREIAVAKLQSLAAAAHSI